MSVKQLNPVYYANVYNNTSTTNDYPHWPAADAGGDDQLYVVVAFAMRMPFAVSTSEV